MLYVHTGKFFENQTRLKPKNSDADIYIYLIAILMIYEII